MRRADRLFDIIQDLRTASHPWTAAALAAKMEVTVRTIYRDIATLQARRIPIEGEPGVGYVLRRGFDLPPLMFTTEEIEAIAVGTRMINRIGDPMLQRAAESVLSKLAVALPNSTGSYLASPRFYMSEGSAQRAMAVDLAEVRDAIRSSRKMHPPDHLAHCDGLLCRRDVDRRVVRAQKRLSQLPGRAHRHFQNAHRAFLAGSRAPLDRMAGTSKRSTRPGALAKTRGHRNGGCALALLRLDAGGTDHPAPFLGFLRDQLAELGG
jgi:hypothetical protein